MSNTDEKTQSVVDLGGMTVKFGEGKFKLKHSDPTTERALAAADRIEAVIARYMNGDELAMNYIDVGDLALLVQHARNVGANPELCKAVTEQLQKSRADEVNKETARVLAMLMD